MKQFSQPNWPPAGGKKDTEPVDAEFDVIDQKTIEGAPSHNTSLTYEGTLPHKTVLGQDAEASEVFSLEDKREGVAEDPHANFLAAFSEHYENNEKLLAYYRDKLNLKQVNLVLKLLKTYERSLAEFKAMTEQESFSSKQSKKLSRAVEENAAEMDRIFNNIAKEIERVEGVSNEVRREKVQDESVQIDYTDAFFDEKLDGAAEVILGKTSSETKELVAETAEIIDAETEPGDVTQPNPAGSTPLQRKLARRARAAETIKAEKAERQSRPTEPASVGEEFTPLDRKQAFKQTIKKAIDSFYGSPEAKVEKKAGVFDVAPEVHLERESMMAAESAYLYAYKEFHRTRKFGRREPKELVELKSAYDAARLDYAGALESSASKRLIARHMDKPLKGKERRSPEEIMARYNRLIRFNEIVKPAAQKKIDARIEGLKLKEKSTFEKGVAWVANQNKALEERFGKNGARFVRAVAVSAAAAGIGAFGGMGVAAAAGYGALRLGKSLSGMFLGIVAGEAGAKAYEKLGGRKMQEQAVEALRTAHRSEKLDLEELNRADSEREGLLHKADERTLQRNKAIVRALTAMGVGAGSAALLTELAGAQAFAEHAEIENGSGEVAPLDIDPASPPFTIVPEAAPQPDVTYELHEQAPLSEAPVTVPQEVAAAPAEAKPVVPVQSPEPQAEIKTAVRTEFPDTPASEAVKSPASAASITGETATPPVPAPIELTPQAESINSTEQIAAAPIDTKVYSSDGTPASPIETPSEESFSPKTTAPAAEQAPIPAPVENSQENLLKGSEYVYEAPPVDGSLPKTGDVSLPSTLESTSFSDTSSLVETSSTNVPSVKSEDITVTGVKVEEFVNSNGVSIDPTKPHIYEMKGNQGQVWVWGDTYQKQFAHAQEYLSDEKNRGNEVLFVTEKLNPDTGKPSVAALYFEPKSNDVNFKMEPTDAKGKMFVPPSTDVFTKKIQ